MAHDPFRGAKRPPIPAVPPVAAETAQEAFSGPAVVPTPDPPIQPAEAQEGALVGTVDLDWNLVPIAPPALPGGEERSGVVEQVEPFDGLVRVEEPQPARGYPCRLASCGQVLASPGALGGHMAAHRKRGELD